MESDIWLKRLRMRWISDTEEGAIRSFQMKKYKIIVGIALTSIAIAILGFVFITRLGFANAADVSRQSIILLNHIVKTAEQHRKDLSALEEIDADFVVLGSEDQLLYSHVSDETLPGSLSVGVAIQKRYPYSYLTDGGKVWGTVILLDDPTAGMKRMTGYMTFAFVILLLLISVGMLLYGIYIQRNFISPFRNMKEFATKIAQGKLDEPLGMDRDNIFGAFSESFDIMREELAETKKRELELQKKERELVASLSHDLKTPVTGIKLTAELMQMRMSVKTEQTNVSEVSDTDIFSFTRDELVAFNTDVKGIYDRAEQIDSLLADLFTSTLDDLGEFKVNCRDEEAKVLSVIVKAADDKAYAVMDDIPDVIINIDRKRMSQVIGNIISNSYKYADTQINIHFQISEKYLEMQIADQGPGVPPSEIDLITNKFYRGKDWQDTDKDGNGLGLYIARSLMTKMNGDLIAESDGTGLKITLVIPLS